MLDVAFVAKPVQELTRKSVVFHWGKKQQTAFEELKRPITQVDTGLFKDRLQNANHY